MIKVITNPDNNFAEEVRSKIKENKGHCACAIILNPDNKCMCKDFREQIENNVLGECHCGLYSVIEER